MRFTTQGVWSAWRARRLKLCFVLGGSPDDGFCGQIAMFRTSLDYLGGIYKRATVVAVFGDPTILELPGRWRPHFERIITHHLPPEDFAALGYYLPLGLARWTNIPDECDFVIFSDADTIVLRPIDDLLERLLRVPAIAGTIAHWPFPQFPGEDSREKWTALAREWLGRAIPFDYRHSLTTDRDPPSQRECPFYLNYGCVIVPRRLIDQIRPIYLTLPARIAPQLQNPFFAAQVSLTLAIYAHNTPRHAVDLRYNFPNDELAEALYPESLHDLRVIHYLRTHQFDRQQIFASAEQFHHFLDLDLSGSNKLFQDHVRRLTQSRYPF